MEFTAWWSSDVTTNNSPKTQDEVNTLICDIQKSADSKIPTSAGYTNIGTTYNTMWVVATSGVIIANGISAELADPFYPGIYSGNEKKCTSVSACTEKVDNCLAHPQ